MPHDHDPHVLIVDDSRMVRASLNKHLHESFLLSEASDGEEAWDVLTQNTQIDLLISDLTMPKLDGLGLLARVRQSNDERIKQLPVIIISGEEDAATRAHAKEMGATDFISKSASKEMIIQTVQNAIKPASTTPAVPATPALESQAQQLIIYASTPILTELYAAYGQDLASEALQALQTTLQPYFAYASVTCTQQGVIFNQANVVFTDAYTQIIPTFKRVLNSIHFQIDGQDYPINNQVGFAHSDFDLQNNAENLLKFAQARAVAACI